MNNPTPQITNTKLVQLAKTYWAWRRLWLATTVAFGGFGLAYVLFLKSDTWTASQGLIVRDEANGAVMRLGRFQSQTEMKAAQETILEMARNNLVLREALQAVGPAKGMLGLGTITGDWPSQKEVSALADEAIGVRAPKGAEFGTTEVIYLDIKQPSRERAIELNLAVCKALDNRLRQVRVARADGVITELARAGSLASEELRKATEQLQIVERDAGADLSDLRGLSEASGNGNTSRQLLDTVKTELRQLENQHNLLLTDYALLRDTQIDPERLLSAPASILNAHPGLKKLREGLADAQLASSQLRGRFTSTHPLVSVAQTSETEIKIRLQIELALALATAGKDVENSQARLDNLKRQQRQLEERLERLARIRADHEKLNQEVRARTAILQDAERELADARAARDAALTSSLLTRLDEPVLGERPIGPGRTTILGAMTLAGLCFGLGIVFLLTPLDGELASNDRWNERLGRRLSDRFPWLADQPAGTTTPLRRRNDPRGNKQRRRQADMGSTVDPNVQPLSVPSTGHREPASEESGQAASLAPVTMSMHAAMNSLSPSELSALTPVSSTSAGPVATSVPPPLQAAPPTVVVAGQPSASMFPPNQVVAAPAPQRSPERVVISSANDSIVVPATDKPRNMLPINSYDTTVEGGLAGIGLPTQPLPPGMAARPPRN